MTCSTPYSGKSARPVARLGEGGGEGSRFVKIIDYNYQGWRNEKKSGWANSAIE